MKLARAIFAHLKRSNKTSNVWLCSKSFRFRKAQLVEQYTFNVWSRVRARRDHKKPFRRLFSCAIIWEKFMLIELVRQSKPQQHLKASFSGGFSCAIIWGEKFMPIELAEQSVSPSGITKSLL